MTLLELVVGLTVTGLVLSAAYAALASVLDRRAEVERVGESVARAAAKRRRLVGWLADARLVGIEPASQFRGLDGVRDGVPDDEMTFVTISDRGEGPATIRLFIDRDSTTPERGLVAVFGAWRGSTLRRVEIEPSASGLDVQYASTLFGVREWLPSWISSSLMPDGVRVALSATPPDTLQPLLRRPILAAIGGAP